MIYFDNASTTFLDEKVKESFMYALNKFIGNPSNTHSLGIEAKLAIERTREIIANYLKVNKSNIFFTSGATESNNISIFSAREFNKFGEIITTKIEHKSILSPILELKKEGYKVKYIALDDSGKINLKDLERKISANTLMCCISVVNNEIGTIQDIELIGKIIKNRNPNTLFMVDAVQAIGHIYLDIKKYNIDFLTFSSHKIYGPKGIGVLFASNPNKIHKIFFGGNQENNKRPGTENVYGIYALGTAILRLENYESQYKNMKKFIITELKKNIKECVFINEDDGTNHILSITLRGIPASYLTSSLNAKNIYISTASACTQEKSFSHVVATLRSKEFALSTIRISFGKYNTIEECQVFINELCKCYNDFLKLNSK